MKTTYVQSSPAPRSATRKKRRRPKGTGSLFKVGRIWYFQYLHRGKRYQQSSGSENKTDAEEMLQDRIAKIRVGQYHGRKIEEIMVGELATRLLRQQEIEGNKTIRDAEIRLSKHVAPFFDCEAVRYCADCGQPIRKGKCGCGERDKGAGELRFVGGVIAVDVSDQRLNDYANQRRRQQAANGTIVQEFALLKRMFRLGKVPLPNFPKLKLNNTRKGFLEHGTYVRLRDALPDYLKPLLVWGYHTGMRLGEIKGLEWDQVTMLDQLPYMTGKQMQELVEVILRPGTTKNDEPRTIPLALSDELFEVLRMQLIKRNKECPDCPYIFFRVRRKRDGTIEWRRIGNFRKMWRRVCICLGLGKVEWIKEKNRYVYNGLLFHDLRRSGVRNMDRSGIQQVVAMKISGHKTLSVYNRYSIVSSRDLREAAKKLRNYTAEQASLVAAAEEGAAAVAARSRCQEKSTSEVVQ